MEWSFGCASAHFALPPFRRLLPSLSHSNAGQRPVLLLILGWCTVPCGRCRGSVPSHRGTLIVTDPAPVEGSHGGAPAHLALRSSLRLVTRVNALRFCLSRLGPPPRAVVSGASHAPRVSAVCGIRICSSGTRWMGALPALRLISPCRPFPRSATGPASCVPAHPALLSFPRLLPPSFSNAGQRSVLLPILTGVLSRVAVVGEGEFTVS